MNPRYTPAHFPKAMRLLPATVSAFEPGKGYNRGDIYAATGPAQPTGQLQSFCSRDNG